MKNFINTIKKKWITNTSKTIFLIFILIFIFVFIYITVSKAELPTFDLTKSKLFTLSNISKEKLQDIKYDVYIYFFGNNMSEDLSIYGVAEKYNKINSKIRSKVILPNDDPEFCEKYGLTSSMNVILVESSNGNYKLLNMSDFYTTDYTNSTTIDLTEQELTNAIIDVQTDNKSNIYFLTGHSESINLSYLKYYIENDINNILNLNISENNNIIPENCNCLFIASPKTDFSDADVVAITNYINKGGNIIWLGTSKSTTLPNVQKVLDLYGVSLSGETIAESTYLYTINGDLNTLIPTLSDHTITKYLFSDGYIALFSPTSINIVDDSTLTTLGVTPNIFMKSSSTSLFKKLNEAGVQEATDQTGPYNIGGEFIKNINESTTSKLILIGDSNFLSDSLTISNKKTIGPKIANNKDLILNSISYLTNHSDLVIRKSTPIINIVNDNNYAQIGMVVIIIFIIPILILITGLMVWIVRRRKK